MGVSTYGARIAGNGSCDNLYPTNCTNGHPLGSVLEITCNKADMCDSPQAYEHTFTCHVPPHARLIPSHVRHNNFSYGAPV